LIDENAVGSLFNPRQIEIHIGIDDPVQSIFLALVVWRDARDETGFFQFPQLSVEATA
jgi:hypothetical protein